MLGNQWKQRDLVQLPVGRVNSQFRYRAWYIQILHVNCNSPNLLVWCLYLLPAVVAGSSLSEGRQATLQQFGWRTVKLYTESDKHFVVHLLLYLVLLHCYSHCVSVQMCTAHMTWHRSALFITNTILASLLVLQVLSNKVQTVQHSRWQVWNWKLTLDHMHQSQRTRMTFDTEDQNMLNQWMS